MIRLNFYNADLFGAIRIERPQQCNEKHFYQTCRTWIMRLFGVRSIGVWVISNKKKVYVDDPKVAVSGSVNLTASVDIPFFTWGCKSRTC